MIHCVGDSLTKGKLGYSYVPYLKQNGVVNHGINGISLSYGLDYIKKMINKEKEIYIICLGANDVLMPFLKEVTDLGKLIYSINNPSHHFCEDNDRFSILYEKLIRILLDHNKDIILIGLPTLELKDFPDTKLNEYNQIIEELAEKYNLPFIDMKSLEEKRKEKSEYSPNIYMNKLLPDKIKMSVSEKYKGKLTDKRKLSFTVDGVHYNKEEAILLADNINLILNQIK